jgi:hypothetical protein
MYNREQRMCVAKQAKANDEKGENNRTMKGNINPASSFSFDSSNSTPTDSFSS